METRRPSRYLLRPGTYPRHLGWAAVVIGLVNMAVAIIGISAGGPWTYFFGAMSWTAAAAMMLSAKTP